MIDAREAFYFGCLREAGHYWHDSSGRRSCFAQELPATLPWDLGLLDGGLLKNGNRPDLYDGRVWRTCGGRAQLWHAYFWWDNSVDRRGGSNSGFYVRGYGLREHEQAWSFACQQWPQVVKRQQVLLVLQP